MRIADYVFYYIFKKHMGKTSRRFIENLSYIFMGTFFASLLTFVLNIVMIRFLGPTEYGIFTLILVIANFFVLPMVMGFDTSSTYYLARGNDKKRVISTAFTSVFFFSVILSVLFLFFIGPIAELFATSEGVILYAIIYAFAIVLYKLFQSVLQGLHMMKKIALLKVAQHVIMGLLLAFFLFVIKDYTFINPLTANFAGYFCVGLIILIYLRKNILNFSRRCFVRLGQYGFVFFLVNVMITLINSIHLLFVNFFLGLSAFGIYAAYYTASKVVTEKLYVIFVTVFFPTVSGKINKKAVIKAVNRLFPIATLSILVINLFIILSFVYFYGDKYPFYAGLVILFSVDAALRTVYKIEMWLLGSFGMDGAKKTIKGMSVITVLNVGLNLVLIPIFALYGAVMASVITHSIFIGYFKLMNRKMVR
jgi:O-antigen/teichoic acid export membrane protein